MALAEGLRLRLRFGLGSEERLRSKGLVWSGVERCAVGGFRRGLASGVRLSTCTSRRRRGGRLRVCLYEIPLRELPSLYAREARLRLSSVQVLTSKEEGREGEGEGARAVMCTEYSDEEYRRERCASSEQYEREVRHVRVLITTTTITIVISRVMIIIMTIRIRICLISTISSRRGKRVTVAGPQIPSGGVIVLSLVMMISSWQS